MASRPDAAEGREGLTMTKQGLMRGAAFPPQAQLFAFAQQSAEPSDPALGAKGTASRQGVLVLWSRYVTILAAALMALAPMQAAAQTTDSVSVRNRPRPEYDPLGRRVGVFDLNATLDLSVTSTDNVFAAETNEQDDIITAVAPSVRLTSNWLRHAVGVAAGARATQFADLSSQDVTTGYVNGFGRLDIGRDTTVNANALFAREVEDRTNPDAPVGGDPVEYDHNDFSLSLRHVFNRFRVTLEAGHGESNYKGAQSFRDVAEDRGIVRLDAEVTPRLGVFAEAQVDQRDYDNNPNFGSDGQTYLAGLRFSLTDLIVGEASVGQFKRDFDGGGSIDGVAVRGDVEWYVTRLTTVRFTASRDANEIGGVVISPYVETNFGARVDHELQRNLILSAGAQVGRREYDVIDRDDEFSSIDLGVEYLVNRNVAVNAGISRDTADSTGVNRYRDYEVNALTVGVSFRL